MSATEDRPDKFIPIREVEEISGFHRSTILRKIAKGEFPDAVIADGNVKRWSAIEIQKWRDQQFAKREERRARAIVSP